MVENHHDDFSSQFFQKPVTINSIAVDRTEVFSFYLHIFPSRAVIMASDSGFSFLPQGAIIQEFKVAGHNIVLGFPKPEPYATSPFFGETIGRVANRIKNSEFTLNGRSYKLAANDGKNHLHGGKAGWGKQEFSGPDPVNRNGKEAVLFTYLSPDEEEGYPGTVGLKVWYTAYEENEDGVSKTVLETEYEVELLGSECDETVVNVTNHG